MPDDAIHDVYARTIPDGPRLDVAGATAYGVTYCAAISCGATETEARAAALRAYVKALGQ